MFLNRSQTSDEFYRSSQCPVLKKQRHVNNYISNFQLNNFWIQLDMTNNIFDIVLFAYNMFNYHDFKCNFKRKKISNLCLNYARLQMSNCNSSPFTSRDSGNIKTNVPQCQKLLALQRYSQKDKKKN